LVIATSSAMSGIDVTEKPLNSGRRDDDFRAARTAVSRIGRTGAHSSLNARGVADFRVIRCPQHRRTRSAQALGVAACLLGGIFSATGDRSVRMQLGDGTLNGILLTLGRPVRIVPPQPVHKKTAGRALPVTSLGRFGATADVVRSAQDRQLGRGSAGGAHPGLPVRPAGLPSSFQPFCELDAPALSRLPSNLGQRAFRTCTVR
jgi:hypothetical protein